MSPCSLGWARGQDDGGPPHRLTQPASQPSRPLASPGASRSTSVPLHLSLPPRGLV